MRLLAPCDRNHYNIGVVDIMVKKPEKQASSKVSPAPNPQSVEVFEENLPDTVQQNPMALIEAAVNGGVDIDKLERLFDLQERWEKQQARASYYRSMARFQAELPVIRKTKNVNFNTSKGVTNYNYAPLDSIAAQIKEPLHNNGFSYRWAFSEEDGDIVCSCTLTHIDGHSETSTMTAEADDSGRKNSIQAIGSSRTYLQRYTLVGVAGLTTAEEDNDARSVGGSNSSTTNVEVEEQHLANCEKIIEEMESLGMPHPRGVIEMRFGGHGIGDLNAAQTDKLKSFISTYESYQKEYQKAKEILSDDYIGELANFHEFDEPLIAKEQALMDFAWLLHFHTSIMKASNTIDIKIFTAIKDAFLLPLGGVTLIELDLDQLKDLHQQLVDAYNGN